MVRLKVFIVQSVFYTLYTISIPYGAIKSITRNTSSTAACKISIPYGAIKRVVTKYAILLIGSFQFLMVRLKVSSKSKYFTSQNISIPYGAIKSTTVFVHTIFEVEFQFLMVRLKVQRRWGAPLQVYNFNSLWCD